MGPTAAAAVRQPRPTLPSITATHEFVVPRSMPITSSALRALDMLQDSTESNQRPCLGMLAACWATTAQIHSPQPTNCCWQGLLEPCLHKMTDQEVVAACELRLWRFRPDWRLVGSSISPAPPPHSSRCDSTSCCEAAASHSGVLLTMQTDRINAPSSTGTHLQKSFLDGSSPKNLG
jgi:hypothetical protein